MRVLGACSLGGAGHLNPLVPFLAAAARRGDEVRVVGPPALGGMVTDAGFTFQPGGEPAEGEVGLIRERLAVASAEGGSALGNRELFGRLGAAAMLPHVRRLCHEWRPDVVLRDPCEYASAIVAGELGIPAAQVAISLAEAEEGSISAALPALEDHRAGLVDELRAEPYLTRFPQSLDPSPFPATIRYREPQPAAGMALPDWWPGSQGSLIYLTLGSVASGTGAAAGVFRLCLDAMAGLDARVLLTVGRTFDPRQLGDVPENVHVEAWVPQADVLATADLVVCHGGSGTILGALAASVPVVTVPVFADQFPNGRRLAAAGAGLTVEAPPVDAGRQPPGGAETPRLADAVRTVLGDAAYRRGAQRIAAEMAAMPTTAAVLAELSGRPLRADSQAS